jgi:hypothetical protein
MIVFAFNVFLRIAGRKNNAERVIRDVNAGGKDDASIGLQVFIAGERRIDVHRVGVELGHIQRCECDAGAFYFSLAKGCFFGDQPVATSCGAGFKINMVAPYTQRAIVDGSPVDQQGRSVIPLFLTVKLRNVIATVLALPADHNA